MDQTDTAVRPSSRVLSRIRAWAFQGLLILFILGLCVLNLFLIQQNRVLKAEIIANETRRFLQVGDSVPDFEAKTISGEELKIDFSKSEKTVLLVFQPQCPACEQVAPLWRQIQGNSETRQHQVFGISLGETAASNAFLSSNGLSLLTFVDLDAATKALYKLDLTPLTIVIDKTGKVERIWPGAFNRETKPDVEDYFGILAADEAK